MSEKPKITIAVELTDQEAWDFAQFLKRVGFRHYLGCAMDNGEAYRMLDVGEKFRKALAEAGYAPR